MADERMDTMALEEVQNRLHASLIKSAAANPLLRAGDWVQGVESSQRPVVDARQNRVWVYEEGDQLRITHLR